MRAIALAALILCAVPIAHAESGIASVYGLEECNHPVAWPKAADGRGILDCQAPVAAHLTLPFGSWVNVKVTATGRSMAVQIVDRGPHRRGRIIDVPPAIAAALRCDGVCHVTVEPITGYVPQHGDFGRF